MADRLALVVIDPRTAPRGSGLLEGETGSRRLKWSYRWCCLFIGVTVTIYTGVATPTEASALGALGALILGAWRERTLTGQPDEGAACTPRSRAAA